MRILIFNEKDYNRYFSISSDKELYEICVKILEERKKEGWYDLNDEPEAPGLTPEAVKALPKGTIRNEAERLQEEYLKQMKEWGRELQFKKDMAEVIKKPYPGDSAKTMQRLAAFYLLQSRNSYEYEQVILEETEN